MALPFLRGVTRKYDVTVMCHPGVGRLLNFMIPEVKTRVVEEGWRNVFKACFDLRKKEDFDISLCVWPDPRVHMLMTLVGSPRRVGFSLNNTNYIASSVPWRRRRMRAGKAFVWSLQGLFRRKALTTGLDKHAYSQHHIEDWNQIADALGVMSDFTFPWFSPPALSESLSVFLAQHPGQPVWVVHSGGRLPTKRWPVERYTEILKRMHEGPDPVVLIIDPKGEPCPETFGKKQLLVQTPDFGTLAAVLNAADHVLANDSFAGHFAAALGKNVVSLFGSGNPDWFAPYGNRQNCLRSTACPHHPCLDRCVMKSPICLESLSTVDVIKKVC